MIAPGTHQIMGRAWAGCVDIAKVEFSSDNGKTWQLCNLEAKNGTFGWAKWTTEWTVEEEGPYVLQCRCVDVLGDGTPTFNFQCQVKSLNNYCQ